MRPLARVFLNPSETVVTRLLGFACVACMELVLGLSTPAQAVAIYSYTGNSFTGCNVTCGPYTTSDFITVSMTLDNPIPANETGFNPLALVALTASDGVQTLDLSTPNLSSGFAQSINTDGAGNITAWEVVLETSDHKLIETLNTTSGFLDEACTSDQNPTVCAFNDTSPGKWTLVPEANTVTFLVMGLVAMCGLRRQSV